VNSPVFVLDTHAIVWFTKGSLHQIGSTAFFSMSHYRARIVVPSYAFTEIQQKFNYKMDGKRESMRIPPTPLLRLISICSNVRILPRGPATLAWEFKLLRDKLSNGISDQDIPIAATTMVTRDYYDGPVGLITRDGSLSKWASSVGIPIVWSGRKATIGR
jgi:hypothetical protein